jgi:hypothetical protein
MVASMQPRTGEAESDTDALCLVAFSLRVQSRTGQWKVRLRVSQLLGRLISTYSD